jgi:hypothetical protein
MERNRITALLAGGDRRSIGRADSVAAMVAKNPKLFGKLITGLWDADPVVRMRSADAMEKVTRKKPELLYPYRRHLLSLLAEADEQEVRWHLAIMVPRLTLNEEETKLVVSVLSRYLDDKSSIVKTFALQGLADLVEVKTSIRPTVVEILHQARRNGTAAMKARSKKLLKNMEKF